MSRGLWLWACACLLPPATAGATDTAPALPLGAFKLPADTTLWTFLPNRPLALGQETWDFDARLDRKYVVWHHDDGNDWEIYVGSPGEGCWQLTSNQTDDVCPDVADGLVTWWGFDGHGWEVFVWEGEQGITQLTHNEFNDEYPRTSRGRVVWYGGDGNDWELFCWDTVTRTIMQLTDNDTDDGAVDIDGDEIVWMAYDGHDFEIQYANLRTGERRQLTDNDVNDRLPSIDDGMVAWESGDGEEAEIWVLDPLHGVRRITDNDTADWFVDVCGRRVVWEHYEQAGDIMLWDATEAPPVIVQITDSAANECNPRTNGVALVWSQRDTEPPGVPMTRPGIYDENPMVETRVTGRDYDVFLMPDVTSYCALARAQQVIETALGASQLDHATARRMYREAEGALRAMRAGTLEAPSLAAAHLQALQRLAAQAARPRAHEQVAQRIAALAEEALRLVQ